VADEPEKFLLGLTRQLCKAVRHHIDLHTPDKQGVTKRDHLIQAQRALGKPIEELRPYPLPKRFEYLVDWFWDLDMLRESTFSGLSRVKLLEIEAWERRNGIELTLWELDSIRAMETERLKEK
jgi:hypothetical protein